MDNALHAIPSKLSHSIITSNAQARSEDAPRFRTSRVLVPNPFTPSQMISHLLIGNHISISTLRRWSRKPELTSAFRAAITPYIVWDDIARESQGWFQPRHLREDPYAAPQEASRQALGQLADQDRVQFGLIERATALCADEESISLMCGALCGNNLNEACHVFHDLAKAMHQRHGYQGDTGSVVSDVSAKKFDNLLEDINLDAEYFQYYRQLALDLDHFIKKYGVSLTVPLVSLVMESRTDDQQRTLFTTAMCDARVAEEMAIANTNREDNTDLIFYHCVNAKGIMLDAFNERHHDTTWRGGLSEAMTAALVESGKSEVLFCADHDVSITAMCETPLFDVTESAAGSGGKVFAVIKKISYGGQRAKLI